MRGLIVVGVLAFILGCTAQEWQDIGAQLAQEGPGSASRGLVRGPAGMAYEIMALVVSLGLGWYARKYGVKYDKLQPHIRKKK